jgi:cytochrome c-type biogenesis protein CcmF
MEKRDALKVWTILLAILTFSLSLLGTFLVRSGVLTSVHAFAVDPRRGIFILAIMALFTGGGLSLFAWRASAMRQGALFAPISREGSLVLNNILLATACATVLIGTLYPLLLESLTGAKISVGPPYFNLTFGPLMLPLLIALPFGPLLAWKRADLPGAAQRLLFAAVLAIAVLAITLAAEYRGPLLAPFGLALGVYVMAGALSELAWRVRFLGVPLEECWRRLKGLPRSAFGTTFGHFGIGMLVVGIVATSAYRQERILIMKPGDEVSLAGYTLAFRGVAPATGPNYRADVGQFDIARGGKAVARLEPSKRLYDAPPQPTTEAGIHASWRGDLYVVLGDAQQNGGYAVRVYFNPLVRFIWLGALIMFLGGAVSLSDRRLRVGAPRRSRRLAMPAPAE